MGGRYGRKGVPQEILDAMKDAMEQGQSMEQAAQEAGISMSTAKKYRDKGMLDVGQSGKHVKEIDLTREPHFRGGTRMDGTPAAVPKEENRPPVCEAAEDKDEAKDEPREAPREEPEAEPQNESRNDTKEEKDMEKWENMVDETKAETVTRMEKALGEQERELKNSADEKLLALRLINDVIKGMRDLEMYVEDGILVDQYAESTVKEARQSLESVRSDTFSDLVDWDMVVRTAEER